MYNLYNDYNTYGANPYQPVYRNQSPQWQGVRFVSGLAEARSCVVPLGTKVILMDSNEDKFYLKENDFNGVSTVSQYRFSKIEEEPAGKDYITRQEFEKWKESYESTIKQQFGSTLQQQPRDSWPGSSISQDDTADTAASTSPGPAVSEGQFRFS